MRIDLNSKKKKKTYLKRGDTDIFGLLRECASEIFDVDQEAIMNSRVQRAADAKRSMIGFLTIDCEWGTERVAELFDIHYTTVLHHKKKHSFLVLNEAYYKDMHVGLRSLFLNQFDPEELDVPTI